MQLTKQGVKLLGNRLSMSSFPSVIFSASLHVCFQIQGRPKMHCRRVYGATPLPFEELCPPLNKAVYHTLGGSCYFFPSRGMFGFAYHSGIGCFPKISRCLSSFLRLFFSSLSSGSSSSGFSSTGSSLSDSASVFFSASLPCAPSLSSLRC